MSLAHDVVSKIDKIVKKRQSEIEKLSNKAVEELYIFLEGIPLDMYDFDGAGYTQSVNKDLLVTYFLERMKSEFEMQLLFADLERFGKLIQNAEEKRNAKKDDV